MQPKLKTPLLKESGSRRKMKAKQDVGLVSRAIKERWPIPEAIRKQVAERVATIATKKGDDANSLRAAQVLASMDSLNRQDEEKANENYRLDQGKLTARVGVEPLTLERPV